MDKFSFLASAVIIMFWYISNDAYHTNIALQTLTVTGYIVLANNIYKQKKNSESFLFWGLGFIASALSFIPAYGQNNSLAIINSWRATVLIMVILSFMIYYRNDNTCLNVEKK